MLLIDQGTEAWRVHRLARVLTPVFPSGSGPDPGLTMEAVY